MKDRARSISEDGTPVGVSDGSRPESRWPLLLVAAAVALLIGRGPWLALKDSGDFAVIYASTRAWLTGQDPHDSQTYHRIYRRETDRIASRVDPNRALSLYPPTVYGLMAPLATMDWVGAKCTLAAINVVVAAAILWALPPLAGIPRGSVPAWLLIASVAAMAPLHTAIKLGQLSVLAVAGLVFAVLLNRRSRPVWAGLLLGGAVALKISVALPFAAYFLCRGQWRCVLASVVVLTVLAAAGIGRFEAAGIDWFAGLSRNIDHLTADGGYGDPTTANRTRHQLINLHYPLHNFTDDRELVSFLTRGLVGILAVLTIVLLHRQTQLLPDLLGLSMVGVLAMLVSYHRVYDATVLVFPVSWAFARLGSAPRGPGVAALAAMGCFLLPGTGLLSAAANRGWVGPQLTSGNLWQMLILPHQVLALLLLVAILLYGLFTGRRPALPGWQRQ